MNISDFIAIATAVVGILGAIVAAIINYVSINSSTKGDMARIKIEEKRSESDTEFTNVNAATQMLNIGLQQATFLQSIYSDCMTKKEQLENENNLLKLKIINFKIFVLDMVSKRNDIMGDFKDHFEEECAEPCDECLQLLTQLDAIMHQIEEEANR